MLIKFVRVPDIRLEISTCRVYDSDSRTNGGGGGRREAEELDEDRRRRKKIAGKAYRSVRVTDAFLETASSITKPSTPPRPWKQI